MPSQTPPPPLTLYPDHPASSNPGISTPPSAIISVPASWGMADSPSGSTSAGRASTDGEDHVMVGHMEPPLPLSASSSSSPSRPLFWPPVASTSSSSGPTTAVPLSLHRITDRPDPFDNTSSFAEDPFAPQSSSSSSGEDESSASMAGSFTDDAEPLAEAARRVRSVSDTMDHDGLPTDPEFSIGSQNMEEYTFEEQDVAPPSHPTLLRTFSAPLPSRVGSLRHPLNPARDPLGMCAHPPQPHSSFSALGPAPGNLFIPPLDGDSSDSTGSSPATIQTPLQTLSRELADSLQSAIQTLLHLSPPHLLDNAKEQYSGCSVNLPTTSVSALLTSMRSLNYLSANVETLCNDLGSSAKDEGLLAAAGRGKSNVHDFDIGELLQSVADLLSGQAAQLGVDFVLFHGDVGMKHISVRGDGEGLAYVLSHVIRQILAVASKGDTIELGLQIIPQSPSMTPRVSLPLTAADVEQGRRSQGGDNSRSTSPGRTLPSPPSGVTDGPLLCAIEIVHNIYQTPNSASATPRAELNPFTRLSEESEAARPKLDSLLCRRLLQHQNAHLRTDIQPSSPLGSGMPRRAYEVSVLLPRGKPILEPVPLSVEEEAIRQPFPTIRLAREPTLGELAAFADSLRGKKVFLHASFSSVFARHLTSYLAAWGMDIVHFPTEEGEEIYRPKERCVNAAQPFRHDSGYGGSSSATPVHEASLSSSFGAMALSSSTSSMGGKETDRFIIVDDDVSVLRRELIRIKAEVPSLQLKPRLLKRPTLNSRTRSSPLVRQTNSLTPEPPRAASTVLIHFTSLANYNQVRDIVTSFLGVPASNGMGAFAHPEVMVIPKPVGPRRFLTALHTAVNQPLVDPFFSPIATSPRSPGGGYFPAAGRTPTGSELGRNTGFFDSVAEESAEEDPMRSHGDNHARSPLGEHPPVTAHIVRTDAGLHLSLPTPGDILATPASEYFSSATNKSSSSHASGVVMQSPDGRPFGMFFEPPMRSEGARRGSFSQRVPSDSLRKRPTSRKSSVATEEPAPSSPSMSPSSSRRLSLLSNGPQAAEDNVTSPRRATGLRTISGLPDAGGEQGVQMPTIGRRRSSRRKTLPAADTSAPILAQGRDRSATVTQATRRKTPAGSPIVSSPTTRAEEGKLPAALPVRASASGTQPLKAKKAAKDEVVVPPINVLIVEDNPINQNILSMFLRKKKIKHQSAKDGLEAVEKWRTGGFHLILMDIQLPVMDGIEATKEIRKLERNNNIGIFPSTPVSEVSRVLNADPVPSSPFRSSVIIVALTASSLQSDRVAALAAGCNDFLTKPVSLKWLERKIVEWGSMQALIDFDGWRRWKGSDPKDAGETKRGFQTGPQLAAKTLASRLKIERKPSRLPNLSLPSSSASEAETPVGSGPEINVQVATPRALPEDKAGEEALQAARTELESRTESENQQSSNALASESMSSATSPAISLPAIKEVVEHSTSPVALTSTPNHDGSSQAPDKPLPPLPGSD
ncbi:osomolarity two-component system, response regulator SSK1, partial [Tremellales sp. Uapishka_1]